MDCEMVKELLLNSNGLFQLMSRTFSQNEKRKLCFLS
ncbi:hypothetical protein T4D_190 [Trichinella pseudospiralis]|uniref:Uncharacterized protein n=1 Tax=Trichinella pseudospiralis TaxID=6337 RepID=A0A0V1DSQ7_TRIPS|nr:hypothetical protein T4D_190 [Trichinella pseudospiralis]